MQASILQPRTAAFASLAAAMKLMDMLRRFVWLCTLAALPAVGLPFSESQAQGRSTPSIDPQDHRLEIRATLLKQTPIGSSTTEVQKFITTKLLPKGAPPPVVEPHGATGEAAAKSARKGVKSIRVRLGGYIDNPATIFLTAPLLTEKEVIAEWAFDGEDKLIEVFVDKTSATY